ncbi:hypothetical protein OC846_003774 [Tilletia horrida]|uniref:NADH dehydrogenase [ubiquinone] 1 beta subcomplex subunit 11, mitochondrial n=1 Tax=Tilletia horrida TaxID=155126 RepID=A0AAN6JRQ3_9BASI|nr:hypothetical protein OC846_003774 [Tilletia horrida]
MLAAAGSSRAVSSAIVRASASSSNAATAAASTSMALGRRYASGGSSYNQPTGYLYGEKPPPKGQKREKEDWENLWLYGMFGGMALATVVLMYRPDTTIQTWAMGEAKKRLAESGEEWKYKPSPNSGYPNGIKE